MRSADSVAVSIDEMQSMSSSAFSKMTSDSSYSSGDVGDFGNVGVVETVDVVHDARLVGLQQVLVLAKLGAALQSTIFSSITQTSSSSMRSADSVAISMDET